MTESEESREEDGHAKASKSLSAFRTISEVADQLDLKQHVLRFWESKFSHIKPLKRGGGRRYYRPEDVALLECIRDLLYRDGYTIKGVQKLLRESGGKADKIRESLAAAPAREEPPPTRPAPASDLFSHVDKSGMSPATRQELKGILAELIELKSHLDSALSAAA
ncbi:MAG: hypothetical protein A2516_00355 [Alphaproteobacteria bacterium RIFOXYD12_FULL_60_8]|nr:MAG: hypothetical protein A2516_00355 [Alphaproteobacteria bacterium RIFOXYD12_FULL_60_8]